MIHVAHEKTTIFFSIACFLIEYGGANLSLKNTSDQTPLELIERFSTQDDVNDDEDYLNASTKSCANILLLKFVDYFNVSRHITKPK